MICSSSGLYKNTTEITEAKIKKGEYCGACHNNQITFGVSDGTCVFCHTGNIGATDARLPELKDLPKHGMATRSTG